MAKIILAFPPYWTPAMPHLALPALSSYLRSHGIEVIQRDLNLETFERVLTREYLEGSLARLRQVARSETGHSGRRVGPPRERVQWALAEGPKLAAQVEAAVAVMRSPAFLDGPTGLQAFLTIAQGLEVASLPFYPAALDLLSYTPPAAVDSSRSLLQAVRDEQHNMFLDIFCRGILPDIVREKPDIVGISIPTEGQMLAGMTLAHLVKQSGLACHVTVGGPHITMLRDQLPKVPALFKLIDSAVAFEGEAPLLRLAETLASRGDLAAVPNLIWRDGVGVRVNAPDRTAVGMVDPRLKPRSDMGNPAEAGSPAAGQPVSTGLAYQAPVSTGDLAGGGIGDLVGVRSGDAPTLWLKPQSDMGNPAEAGSPATRQPVSTGLAYQAPVSTGDLALPDFDGLPLGRYLSPYPVLPLLTAHGCYHGDCAFCNVGYGRAGHFKPLKSAQVVEQMLALQRKYGVRHIFFADEAMTPRSMREMSALLAAQGSPIHWCGCMRFEKAITAELLDSMSAAGCRMILFGLETASERMIELMDKGTKRETMGRILRESTAAGIWNHTFFFFGFPTETMADAQDTVNFVYAHGDAIHSASPGEFVLERYSPVQQRPGEFGVRRIIERPEKDLAIYFEYELESGLDEQMAKTITERLLDVLPGKRFGQYYAQDTYRLLYAGTLHEQGQPLPGWLMDEATGT
jgi:radical SAM superfamily enzyme YgiQ (UPF0313 family)